MRSGGYSNNQYFLRESEVGMHQSTPNHTNKQIQIFNQPQA